MGHWLPTKDGSQIFTISLQRKNMAQSDGDRNKAEMRRAMVHHWWTKRAVGGWLLIGRFPPMLLYVTRLTWMSHEIGVFFKRYSHYQPLCIYTKDQLSQRPVARLSTERILICKGSTKFKHIRNIPQCWDVSRVLTGILQQVHSFPNHVPSEFNRI